jgi:hypothetical protein
MNWKLIILLSLFGAAMAVGTVFFIPSNPEPLFWLGIFVVCAAIIATKAPGKYFLHGFALSMVNSVWVTTAHVVFFETYIANHPREAAMSAGMPLPPRLMMIITGPLIGVVTGLIQGLFAYLASRILKRSSTPRATGLV